MRPGSPNPSQQEQAAMAVAMSGAVDLAALKARSEAQQRAASAPAAAAGAGAASVLDVTEETFQAEVLDRSFQVPVLLDLWADWCGPCKQLSPVLEKLAGEGAGAWILAKIDVDANPRIAQALQVQGIPSVFAVIKGQLVPGFQGALPESQVREFITALLQAAEENGLTGAPPAGEEPAADAGEDEEPAPEDTRFTAAEEALEAGDYDLATERYQAILDADPGNEMAGLALRQVAMLRRLDGIDPAVVQRAASEPDDVAAQLAAADFRLAGNDVDGALRVLLDALARLAGEDRDAVRKRLIEYFDLLGPDDSRVGPARREMARSLF